jgi:hypothetical protein
MSGFSEFIDKRMRDLEARLAQGVGKCYDCGKPASGYCGTCNVLLCDDHDFEHLLAPNGQCKEVKP